MKTWQVRMGKIMRNRRSFFLCGRGVECKLGTRCTKPWGDNTHEWTCIQGLMRITVKAPQYSGCFSCPSPKKIQKGDDIPDGISLSCLAQPASRQHMGPQPSKELLNESFEGGS